MSNEQQDESRMAEIGRAVVKYLMGDDNACAMREATPMAVVNHIRRRDEEARSVATSSALRVGRLMLTLIDEVDEVKRG